MTNAGVTDFPDLERFAKVMGIPGDKLKLAFEIECQFHRTILSETCPDKRRELYRNVYTTVHSIYGKTATDISNGRNPNDETVDLFRVNLANKSILDVGCGQGFFLESVARRLKHKELVGIDVSIPELSKKISDIEFIVKDIVRFDLGRRFDVVYSGAVMEHIAPADVGFHLQSINNALVDRGQFIFEMPNSLFGPADITRIVDFSYSGKSQAMGTHLFESTYGEMIPILRDHGFGKFQTVLPIPRLRYKFSRLRFPPGLLVRIEQSRFAINVLRKIRYRGHCILKLPVILLCRKVCDISGRHTTT